VAAAAEPRRPSDVFLPTLREDDPMRGILLWLLGIPIPIIILIYLLY